MSEIPNVTPKDFFMWLGAMVALYFSVGSFIALTFEYIERLVGDAAIIGYDPYSGGIQFAIASLIVIFPVYITLTRMLNQDIRTNPLKKELWVRRWLVFLAVFVAGIAMLVDLIVLISTFLSGEEITAAFLLKVVTVLVVAAGVFYYYLSDIKGKWENREALSKTIAGSVSLLVLISVIAGFFIMGSPQTQRLLRYDQQRIYDLQSIQSQVTNYYQTTEALPESLEKLQDPLVGARIQADPETGDDYEYTKTGDLTFELCATFSLPLPEFDTDTADLSDWRVRELQQTALDWPHGAGRTCFDREIDPDRIVPFNKGPVPIRELGF
jgi:hypothetical protein